MKGRRSLLVEKSVHACLAAIEIYNKPDFKYREEVFAILMLNAWELLLKARIIQVNDGQRRSIEIFDTVRNKDGTASKRKSRKLNRSGNPMTIGLDRAISLVTGHGQNGIDDRCAANLELLREIRDNAVHMYNIPAGLSKRIQEIGSAALKNFVNAAEMWFDLRLDRYNFYLMPLAFHSPSEIIDSLQSDKHPKAVRKLLDQITEVEHSHPSSDDDKFSVTMQIQLKFVRASGADALPVRVVQDDPNAIPVAVTEDSLLSSFPWSYKELTEHLTKRYSDFSQNKKYHKIRKNLEKAEKYSRVRYLDPSKQTGTRKIFYSPGILSEFDRHYTKN